MNECYRNLVLAKVQAAMGAAEALRKIKHKGLKGQLREILIRDLFRPLYPSDIGVGTGEIISARNEHSNQIDVVLYDKSILPPILMEENSGMFPIESVLYTVEIKSILTASAIKSAHETAKQISNMFYLSPLGTKQNPREPYRCAKLHFTLFAFNSDLSLNGKNEIQRYNELRGNDYPFIDVICVVGRGYWYWKEQKWYNWEIKYPLHEVMGFLSGIHNTYREIVKERGTPSFGHYLL